MNEPASPSGRQAQLPKPQHAVFVSYSSHDEEIATCIRSALEAEEIRCWMAPRDVQGGRPYSGQVTQAIREARVLLLVLSQASNRSRQVLREVERAAHCQNHLLTFRIEAIAPGDDLAYFLGADHWVDGFRPLPPSEHLPALIQYTRALLQSGAAEPEEQPDTASPEAFAHFRVLRRPDGSLFRLGEGGMGVTYKAIDTVLNRPVALKVIAAELLRSPASKQRFLREAQAAALIHHPNVATIFHFGEEGDAYFYAMEFVDGEDLERYVAQHGPLQPATSLRVVLQVAQALEAAQAHRLIHRDIKPGNVMAVANRAGTLDVKLIDFGLAKGADAEALDAARITRSQDFVGSPAFASPEQCEMGKLDTRSDIYSLGVTLWYLLSGKRPFSGTVGQVLIAQVVKTPPFEQLAQVPEPIVAVLRRMLAKSPGDRFQTPEELQVAVEVAAAKLVSEFDPMPDRPPAEGKTFGEADPAMELGAEPISLTTLASPLFDSYLTVELGASVVSRYRLVSEEREGNGGRFFHAKDEKAATGQPADVGLKLIHPSIAADPVLIDLLENEIGVIHKAAHPHLVRYWRLERGTPGPWLVREWVNGFLLYDVLRWRRSLSPVELVAFLGPLASTLDFVSNQGLGLVDVSIRKILVACPPEIVPEDFSPLLRVDARDWNRCRVLLNPLSLAPILFRSRNGWDRQTIVPSSRVLSMTQAEAGIRGTKAVRLYGRLVYELLSGRPPLRTSAPDRYTPLPELDQIGNEMLRRACAVGDTTYRSCQEFWDSLKENLGAQVGRPVPPPPPPLSQGSPASPAPLQAPWPLSAPPAPITEASGAQPRTKPSVGTPGRKIPWSFSEIFGFGNPKGPPTTNTPLSNRPVWWTISVAILGGAAIVGLVIFFTAIQSHTLNAPSSTPPPSPIIMTTPTPGASPLVVTPTATASPTVSPARLAPEDASKEHPWENSLGMKFVPVTGTQALFGIWDTRVQDFKAFVLDTNYDATNGMYSLGKDGWKQRGATWMSPGFDQGPTHPVVGISFYDAKAFCEWLTNREHVSGRLPYDTSYRLPTDAEWSIAAGLPDEIGDTPAERNGKINDLYPWGKEWPPPAKAGNFAGEEFRTGNEPMSWTILTGRNDGWSRTSPVGNFDPNRFGLYDMGGNVEQWCSTLNDPSANKWNITNSWFVLRGGSFVTGSRSGLLSSFRSGNAPTTRFANYGFRCVVSSSARSMSHQQ